MAASKSIKSVRNKINQFQVSENFPSGITGIFADKKDGEYRVVILHTAKADVKKIDKAVKAHFGKQCYKLLKQSRVAKCTAMQIPTNSFVRRADVVEPGTLGGYLTLPDNRVLGVSNCHVLAKRGVGCNVGDLIINEIGFPIGKLHSWKALQSTGNRMDLALFELERGVEINWMPDKPQGISGPNIGWFVEHYGAASGQVRKGRVVNRGNVLVKSGNKNIWFFDVWTIQSMDMRPFSIGGDSGSFVRTSNGNYLIACLFASHNNFSYAFSIAEGNELFGDGVW